MNATLIRDAAWAESALIPSWVRGREVDLDQHNTPFDVSRYCLESFKKYLKVEGKKLSDYVIIEPSAGTGSFYDLLPENKRIGIDVDLFEKYSKEYIQADFLTWYPKEKHKKYIAIGNPPFGYRGWLALSFLKHASEFCEYVGFILPMSFQSDGKGSPKYRVNNMLVAQHEILPENLFYKANNDKTNVNTLWQIWKKGENIKVPDLSAINEYVDLFTVDQRKERLCGAVKMKGCNLFLQRTFFSKPPSLVDNFSQVKYSCGYGIIIKKDKGKIMKILNNADWIKYSNLATHNCRHISMYHIKQVLIDNINS